jgi:hypothetical protein
MRKNKAVATSYKKKSERVKTPICCHTYAFLEMFQKIMTYGEYFF